MTKTEIKSNPKNPANLLGFFMVETCLSYRFTSQKIPINGSNNFIPSFENSFDIQ